MTMIDGSRSTGGKKAVRIVDDGPGDGCGDGPAAHAWINE